MARSFVKLREWFMEPVSIEMVKNRETVDKLKKKVVRDNLAVCLIS